jgi:hypothetical protein
LGFEKLFVGFLNRRTAFQSLATGCVFPRRRPERGDCRGIALVESRHKRLGGRFHGLLFRRFRGRFGGSGRCQENANEGVEELHCVGTCSALRWLYCVWDNGPSRLQNL